MQARGGHTNYLNIILKHTSWHREADQGKRKDGGGGGDRVGRIHQPQLNDRHTTVNLHPTQPIKVRGEPLGTYNITAHLLLYC